MNVLDRLQQQLKAMEAVINPSIQETINRSKPLLIDEQTNTQWYSKGQDAEQSEISPSYALSTVIAKQKKGQPTDRVTLKDTGALYDSIRVEATATQLIISANVEYYKYLVIHYDTNILLGLQEPFLKKYIEVGVIPTIKRNWDGILKR